MNKSAMYFSPKKAKKLGLQTTVPNCYPSWREFSFFDSKSQ